MAVMLKTGHLKSVGLLCSWISGSADDSFSGKQIFPFSQKVSPQKTEGLLLMANYHLNLK